ncbi:MAG TPA: Na+/H+ antiporter subunit E [Candidatus Sphingobacterium stercoripullorum]|uniref:Na+/H+ antiporter subunit E n=1 Tax=Candidatus Sphingobacterium stercoripullorum TaxID=2838759 RepID=A0A9D1WA34_9SPHI|nr:Na+/H+ antiporter subunit E [Candidatus Sphingobacterium stercoripullorum]
MVNNFLMNLLLAFTWLTLSGSFSYGTFIFGFILGFLILWFLHRNDEDISYFTKVPKMIGFLLFFLYEMIVANVQVAYDVITPNYFFRPGIVKYNMHAKTDLEINLLAAVIAMTPGTIVVDVSEDKKSIYIHVMYMKDKQKFLTYVENVLERKLLNALR